MRDSREGNEGCFIQSCNLYALEENKSSKPETQGRYQPINKGIEETPVNIRDAQDFPNNI